MLSVKPLCEGKPQSVQDKTRALVPCGPADEPQTNRLKRKNSYRKKILDLTRQISPVACRVSSF